MAEEKTGFDSVQGDVGLIQPPADARDRAWINSMDEYEEMYKRSVDDPEGFWADMAEELRLLGEEVGQGPRVGVRHSARSSGSRAARPTSPTTASTGTSRRGAATRPRIIWEGDEGRSKVYTYQSLYYKVCRFANVLKKHGIKKGDRVAIYMPMIPELAIAMLACARIGAIHSIVFGGFSPQLAARPHPGLRMQDAHHRRRGHPRRPRRAAEGRGRRGAARVPERRDVHRRLARAHRVDMEPGRDFWYHEEIARRRHRPPLRHRVDGRRGPALHPVHVGLDRQAEGRAAHHRRLPASTRR